MNNRKMCRESRKLFSELDRQANRNGVQGLLIIPAHIYMADQLVLKYFTQPMLNVISSRISRINKREYKHFTIEYWYPIMDTMLRNGSAHRDNVIGTIGDKNVDIFDHINRFMITDYSIQDAMMINHIVNNYTLEHVVEACNTAAGANVYEVRYVNAILEKDDAKRKIRLDEIRQINEKIEKSDTILDKPTLRHSPIELAMSEYNWHKRQQDAELIRKFNMMVGGMDNENS